jgi:NAD(P)-dependent dehydrogenase (short-subunit alcohol dehydrogenase family)
MDLQLEGKTALITGGSRGIGKAVARQLAAEGVDIAIAARTPEVLEEAAREIAAESGRKIVPIVVDTGDDASVKAMVEKAVAELGHIDILVNSAAQPGGQGPVPKLGEITNELFWADMNVKVLGYLRCCREVAPHMIQQGWGRIINISGLAARQAGNAIGSMRNVSVASLSKNIADELGPKGINVTCIHPGTTWTEKTPGVIAAQAESQGVTEAEIQKRMNEANSIKKQIHMDEVAHVITFLASPKSIAINGDSIAAGGGAPRAIHY